MASHNLIPRLLPLSLLVAGLLIPTVGPSALARDARNDDRRSRRELKADLKFAAEMAEQGLWKEALFRWEAVLEHRPEDARLLNNIAVAREAIGDIDGARAAYERALALDADDKIIANQALFLRALKRLESDEDEELLLDDEDPGGGAS